MAFLLLLLLFELCGTAHLVLDDEKVNLDCNNDMENIFCQLEANKCSEYNLTIQDDFDQELYSCPLQQCYNKCCCSSEKLVFTFDNNFTVKVWTESKEVEVKIVNTLESYKANAPTLVSVEESNGNIEVRWKTNMYDWFNTLMTAEVTFSEQGNMMEVSKNVMPAIDKELLYYVIDGKDLDSDSTYMVRVRSVTGWNKMYSDSSNVKMIKTSPAPSPQVWPLIIGLSGFAVLLSVFMVWSFAKMKRKLWDLYSGPKVTISHLKRSQVITQMAPDKISTCVTEEEMSKKRWASAIQDEMLPSSPEIVSGCLQDILNQSVSGSGDMLNQTYSLLLPNCSGQQKTSCLEEQSQTEALFGSVCSPNTSDLVNNPDRLARLFPAQQDGSSLVPTEKSRQFIEFPRGVSHAEGFGILGDPDTTACGELRTCVEEGFNVLMTSADKTIEVISVYHVV